MSLLEIHGISKTYARHEHPAVHQVSLSVSSGEFISLVGKSGSGKTTLLRLIAGLETADAGAIRLGGRELSRPGLHIPPEKRGVGLVFQHHALFPHLTVEKNISFGIRQKPAHEQRATVQTLLERIGLPTSAKRYPHELSGGEQQRIALARALATNPGVLLLDEPFSSLDPQLRESMRDETRRLLRSHGATVILVTHHTRDALAISDRIAVMHHGVLEQYDVPREIYHHPVNPYVATLFGPCNFLPPDVINGGQELCMRPDELELVPLQPGSQQHLAGVISQLTYGGGCHHVTLLCHRPGGASLEVKVCHQGASPLKEGEHWGIVSRHRHSNPALSSYP